MATSFKNTQSAKPYFVKGLFTIDKGAERIITKKFSVIIMANLAEEGDPNDTMIAAIYLKLFGMSSEEDVKDLLMGVEYDTITPL